MTHPPPNYIEGAGPVAEYYGYWPTFHDATIQSVGLDGRTNELTIVFILNDTIGDNMGSYLAHVTMKWYGVEKCSLAADYSDSTQNWLWEVNFGRNGDWLETELLANDGIGGTICARRIEVTHFMPFEREVAAREGT